MAKFTDSELHELDKLHKVFEHHVFDFNLDRDNKNKELKKRFKKIYNNLLKKFKSHIATNSMPVYNSQLDDWYSDSVTLNIRYTKELFNEIEAGYNMPKGKEKITPIEQKINWQGGKEELKRQLEILKSHGFIDYTEIESILSGSEVAFFIKHKAYKAPCQNILALYDLWNEKKYISDYIDRERKRQYKEFMENVFNWDHKGEIENIKHRSMGSLYNREIKKIIEVKKHLESILN